MLGLSKHIAFLATADRARAREFYERTLGLKFVEDDGFALVFDLAGTMLRIASVPSLTPAPYTVLGWETAGIEQTVAALSGAGIKFERYGFPGQDESGIWSAPGGAKVAWFKDPDGNVLSVSQHPR